MVFDRSIISVGRGMQDFGLGDLAGVYRNTAKMRVKGWLAVLFFQPDDPNCAQVAQALQEWQTTLPGDKTAILGVGLGERADLDTFVKDKALTYSVVWDYEDYVANTWSVSGVPTLFLTNAVGKVIAHVVGARMGEIAAAKELLLGEIAKAEEAARIAAEAAAKAAAEKAAADEAAKAAAQPPPAGAAPAPVKA